MKTLWVVMTKQKLWCHSLRILLFSQRMTIMMIAGHVCWQRSNHRPGQIAVRSAGRKMG